MDKLGIIGCGNMGGAIAKGIVSKKLLRSLNLYLCDSDKSKAKKLAKEIKAKISSLDEIASKCRTIIIAVKPQDAKKLLLKIKDIISSSTHIISVMAGVKISNVTLLLGRDIAITRAMPNMAAFVGKSITALSSNDRVKNKKNTNRIFLSIGKIVEIDEKLMDAVTAVSGSGPAYFFYLCECLRNSAIDLGIDPDKAELLAQATLSGSAELVDKLEEAPEVLRARVTSKGGTTEAAIRYFEKKRLAKTFKKAIKRARDRAKELSGG